MPDHWTSVGRTQRTCVSAPVHSALQNSAVSVRERYTQQDDRGAAGAADVREGECRSCSHSSHKTCRMQDGSWPSRGTMSATLTSIANVCALRSDISGHTTVASSTWRLCAVVHHIADRPSLRDLDAWTIATHHGYYARATAFNGLGRGSCRSSRCALAASAPSLGTWPWEHFRGPEK